MHWRCLAWQWRLFCVPFPCVMSIVLAFSGGLDTSFCVPYLLETYGEAVYTVTVNTGGLTETDKDILEEKSRSLGAKQHFLLEGRRALYEDHLSYLIKGNVLRGGVYPLCVGSERVVQARMTVDIARQVGARAIAHGSTGAGNDQVRFDVAIRMLADDLEIITPIRDQGLTRKDTTEYLRTRGHEVPVSTTRYSINAGLWGTTIGGAETLGTTQPLPDDVYPDTTSPAAAPDHAVELAVRFEQGLPVALGDTPMDPVSLIERLNDVGGQCGVGRDYHVGDTILGVKGRIGFEAPAAMILITAHRELEKIVLTKWQRYQKDRLADFYGVLLHEGQMFDPVMRDIEAFVDSSQSVVTGTVTVRLFKGHITITGCDSPYSMFNTGVATYGEQAALWDGRDARGFCQLTGVQSYLARKARDPDN